MFGEYVRFHIAAVEWFVFFEVYNIESYSLFAKIFDCEIEPLDMPSRISINSHKKIVLVLCDFYNGIQVTTFKITIKN